MVKIQQACVYITNFCEGLLFYEAVDGYYQFRVPIKKKNKN